MTELDDVAGVFQRGGPATDDVQARVTRARVAAALFGAKQPVQIGRYELERQLGAGGGGVVFIATDPELSRKVALKLITARGERDRMLAEGHALARLAHPNVVPIFDVGTHDDQIFLVMELVEGGTLRTWIEEAPRTVLAIVRAYRDAGAGLAAAHRAGFVHRDFKPDNALIGADQRVRVVDFGLVHVDGEARAGLGTPRYMPPEQAEGGEVTPAADQYAFCASLREAIRARKDADGTRANTVPRWLDDILARGLARSTTERYPSMDALLDALARDPATKWKRRGVVAGILALGASAFAIGRVQHDAPPPCDGGRAELAAVWNPQLRSAVAAKLDALGTPYAKQVKPQLVGALDGYAKAWSAGHLDACKAHRRGAQSDSLLDRRMRCLDAARAALGAAINVVGYARAQELAQAVVATGELPALSRCADAELLASPVAPPTREQAAEASALEQALAAREVDIRAGRADAIPAIDALVARARALGYRPVLAQALRLRGLAAIATEVRADAIAPLTEATRIAFEAHDDELGIEAFARRAWAQATHEERDPALAVANLDVIEAIAQRLPAGARATRALLANNIGGVERSRGRRAEARAAFERAYAQHTDVTGSAAIELAQIPANLALVVDDPVKRDALFAESIAKLTAFVGKSHPVTLTIRVIAAIRTDDPHVAERELASACTELVELHPERGGAINECAFELAWFAIEHDDPAGARHWFTALVTAEARGGDKDFATLARAHLLRLDGDARASARVFAAYRTSLGEAREPWWRQPPMMEAELGRALAERAAGDGAARATFERARELLVAILEKNPSPARKRRLQIVERALSVPQQQSIRPGSP